MKIEGIIRTFHDNAREVADSISVDNLSEMETFADGNYVITKISSTKIRSVIASVDDYLTDLYVADGICGEISSQNTDTDLDTREDRKRCEGYNPDKKPESV